MADTMQGLKRSHYCGEVTIKAEGQEVTVGGFVDRVRDQGTLIFVDLRDRSGIVQLTFDETTKAEIHQKASLLRSEYVVMAKGRVVKRQAKNADIETGEIEIFVTDLRLLCEAATPPFPINIEGKVGEEVRLKYRYLDLRRKQLQRNLKLRHDLAMSTRNYFSKHGFYEIETPMMMKSTPEGARDYLVPSRIHHGKFYALPQSPQIYKQLLMVAGYDRYFQLARCFRDEDLRADRQPEFTQIDFEMSFVEVDDVIAYTEGFMQQAFRDVLGLEIAFPLKRMTYQDAMEQYGSDKPDTRFGMKIIDVSSEMKTLSFGMFSDALASGGSVRAIVAKQACNILSRKQIDELTTMVKGIGAKGLAFVRYVDTQPTCSFSKFIDEQQLSGLLEKIDCKQGDVAFFVADKTSLVLSLLGALRLAVAKKIDCIPKGFDLLWITEFPFFEWNEENGQWAAMHHPFTMPMDECMQYLESDPGKVKAKAYDLVLNGVELSSGSIRITNPTLQQKMFEALGLTKQEIEQKFGFLVDAYRYGAPPHGGMGMGFDRLAMMMADCENLRDVTAFPKLRNAGELMSNCPSVVDEIQLTELGLTLCAQMQEQ